jgi:hypothetical protein
VEHARPGLLRARLLCCGTTRATFSPTVSCLPIAARFWRRNAPKRARAAPCRATTVATPPSALASSGSSDDGRDLLRAQQHKRNAVDERTRTTIRSRPTCS